MLWWHPYSGVFKYEDGYIRSKFYCFQKDERRAYESADEHYGTDPVPTTNADT
tara:strand:+ start:2448 stop:2606 length:159 start_codon:yes stop_codon:yes gene_type:complete